MANIMMPVHDLQPPNAAGKRMCKECNKREAVVSHRYGYYCIDCSESGAREEAMYDEVDRKMDDLLLRGMCLECKKEKARAGSNMCVGCAELGMQDEDPVEDKTEEVGAKMCIECKNEQVQAGWSLCTSCAQLGIQEEDPIEDPIEDAVEDKY